MRSVVTPHKTVAIPPELARQFGIQPGCVLDWRLVEGADEIRVRVLRDRGSRARRLLGAGGRHSPGRDAVAELVAERASEG